MTGPRDHLTRQDDPEATRSGNRRKVPTWYKDIGAESLRKQLQAALEGRLFRRVDKGRTDLDMGYSDDDELPPGTDERAQWECVPIDERMQLEAIEVVNSRVYGKPKPVEEDTPDVSKERDELTDALVRLAEEHTAKAR